MDYKEAYTVLEGPFQRVMTLNRHIADGNIYKFASNARFLLSANKDIYDKD